MLRITTVTTNRRCHLVLEGELISPWLNELNREWEKARASELGKVLVVDLRNVTSVSQEGSVTLLRMMEQGAKFTCGGVLNRHVIQEFRKHVER